MASVDFFIIFLCSIVYIFFLLNDIINYNKSSIKYTPRNDSLKTIKNLFGLSGIVLSVFEFKIAIEQSYCNGIFGIFVFLICDPLSYLLVCFFLIPKLIKSKKKSIYEWIEYFYGDKIQLIFSVGEFISNTAFIAIQLKIIGDILMMLNIERYICNILLLLLTSTVILKSIYDKRDSNVFTLIMKILFITFIPSLFIFLVWKYDKAIDLFSLFNSNVNPRMNFSSYFSTPANIFISLALITRFLFPFVDSTIYHNVVVDIRRNNVLKFTISSVLLFTYGFFYVIIGTLLFGLNSTLEESEVIQYLFNICNYPYVQGLLIVSLIYIGLLLSINTLKSMSKIIGNDFLNNFVSPLYINSVFGKVILPIIIGSIALLFALTNVGALDLFLYASCGNFPTLIVPLTLTILGFRTHRNCVYIALVCGLVSTFIHIIVTLNTDLCRYAFFTGMIFNFISLIISHLYYVYVKGFKFNKMEIDDLTAIEEEKIYKEKSENLINIARSNLLQKIKSLYLENSSDLQITDKELILKYINTDFIKSQVEYRTYKLYIYKFILKEDVANYKYLYSDDKTFLQAVEEDLNKHLNKHE